MYQLQQLVFAIPAWNILHHESLTILREVDDTVIVCQLVIIISSGTPRSIVRHLSNKGLPEKDYDFLELGSQSWDPIVASLTLVIAG